MTVHLRAVRGASAPVAMLSGTGHPTLVETDERMFAARERVFSAGDRCGAPFAVAEGCVLVWSSLSDGRRQIVQVALPGDALGFASGTHHTATAETVARTCLVALTSEAAATELGRRIAALETHVVLLGRMQALERVASLLARLADHIGTALRRGVTVDLPLTRAEMADHLGLTIETVSRSLTKLRRLGLIRLERPERVVIPDLDALHTVLASTVTSC